MHSTRGRGRIPSKHQPLTALQGHNNIIKTTDKKSFYCFICKETVLILSNNLIHGIQEHVKTHQFDKPQSDEELYSFSGIKNWLEQSETGGHVKETSKIQNLQNNVFSVSLKQHESYITNNGSIFCIICNLIIRDHSNSIQEHVKSKLHEDNVISHLKSSLPSHLHDVLKFIYFYDSNLYCDLCECRIELNSTNVYETLMNIMSHNADQCHSSKTVRNGFGSQKTIASAVLTSLAGVNPLIDENKHIIHPYDQSRFKCKLCNTDIAYGNRENILTKNITCHLNSFTHKKIQKANDILKSLDLTDEKRRGSHRFVILDNGNIFCDTCKCNVEPDIEKLLTHKQNPTKVYFNSSLKSSPLFSDRSSSDGSTAQTRKNQYSGMKRWKSFDSLSHSSKKELSISKLKDAYKKTDLDYLLEPLQNEFGNISCMTQNDQDDVMCLLCDSPLPLTTHDIRLHLLEHNFKYKKQSQLCEGTNTSYNDSNHLEQSNATIEKAFRLLPQRLQYDKIYIKDSPIQSYLLCTLCKCVINPHYLKEHLEDEKHIQKKKEF